MRPLWLDYQRSDPTRRRPGMALLALGVVAVLLTSVDYFAVAAERDDAQAQVDALRRAAGHMSTRNAAAPTPAPVAGGPSAQHWESLFASLEAASDETVTLLSLHPGDKDVQLTGEAKDFGASMDYVQRLQAQPALTNARLTQSEIVADNPRHPVRFSLVADWRNPR
jgi:Tfp pilus assembly protein PilN